MRKIKKNHMNELFHMANSEIGKYNILSIDGGDFGETYSYDNAYTPSSYLAEKNNTEPEGTRAGTITGTVD